MAVTKWHREGLEKPEESPRLFSYRTMGKLIPRKIVIELDVSPHLRTFSFKYLQYEIIKHLYHIYRNRTAVSNALGISNKQVYLASRREDKEHSNIKITIK